MLNYLELKTKVAELAQRSDDSDYLSKIGVWLQLSHGLLSEIYDFWIDLQDTHNFSTADGQEDYPLPNRFDKPFRLYDLTNDKRLTWKTEEEYFDGHIANIADGDTEKPTEVRIYGTSGSRVAIATTGKTLQVKSSSASDTTSPIVRIRGYIDSALLIEDYEDITISSSSPTTFVAGTKTFYKLTHISKSANTTGYIIIADSDDTTLETLAPNERVARHKILKLGPIPDDTYSMRLLFKKTIVEMVNNYDYPFTECDRYLIFDAYGYALKQDKEDEKAQFAWGKSKEALQTLLQNQGNKLGSDYQHRITSRWLSSHRM